VNDTNESGGQRPARSDKDDATMMRNECIGSGKAALPSDLLPLETYSRARCSDCHAKVAVWFANKQWTRRGHEVGVDTDENEMAAMVRAGARAAAISLDYDPTI
jgi:hypothetical protein